jgi:hypothetical protein
MPTYLHACACKPLQAETEIGAAHQLMSMAHEYRHKNDMTGSSSVPNLDSGDAIMMSPQRQPYHYQVPILMNLSFGKKALGQIATLHSFKYVQNFTQNYRQNFI